MVVVSVYCLLACCVLSVWFVVLVVHTAAARATAADSLHTHAHLHAHLLLQTSCARPRRATCCASPRSSGWPSWCRWARARHTSLDNAPWAAAGGRPQPLAAQGQQSCLHVIEKIPLRFFESVRAPAKPAAPSFATPSLTCPLSDQSCAFFFSWAAGRCLPKNPDWGEDYGIRCVFV